MTDKDLKYHVQSALDWEPSIDAVDIGVSVEGGVVTLRGNVKSYAEKLAAERTTLRVFGTKGLANDLVVQLGIGLTRTDTDIAQAGVSAIKWNTTVPRDKVTVTVSAGWVTLAGTLDWQYQKDEAERSVHHLTGVKGVVNNILLEPTLKMSNVRDKIEAAFKRSAELDARRVTVIATDGKITLSGNVRSWTERWEAEQAAWATPGVQQVDDQLRVDDRLAAGR